MEPADDGLRDGIIAEPLVLILDRFVVCLLPRLGGRAQEPLPQFLPQVVSPLLANRPQELAEEPMDLLPHLDEPRRLSSGMTAKGLTDEGQPDPLVRLPA